MMNKKIYILSFLLNFIGIALIQAQTSPCLPKVIIEQSAAQVAKEIPTSYSAEDYSGISYLGNNQYAVVSDKKDGFYIFTISLNNDGSINQISRSDLFKNSDTSRDCEGIVFHPGRNSAFISGEADQKIKEYNLTTGQITGTELNIPGIFAVSNGTGNYGFESLGYNATTGLFWTTTESTLSIDGPQASYNNSVNNLLRFQSFGEDLSPKNQYAYKMDLPTASAAGVAVYAFGVPDITALNDGRLLVIEREFYVGSGLEILNSYVNIKIYLVNPALGTDVSGITSLSGLNDSQFLTKELLKEFKTTLNGRNIANYEGMCLGPQNVDGSYTLLLINDSQSRYLGVLNEYILPLTLRFFDDCGPSGIVDQPSKREKPYIVPNPVKDRLTVETGTSTIESVEVSDLSGKVIHRASHLSQRTPYSLDCSGWTNGIYLIKINTPEGVFTSKIFKE